MPRQTVNFCQPMAGAPPGDYCRVLTPEQGQREGERRKLLGMELAARRKAWLIRGNTLRFLDAMMGRADRTASTDDAADDLASMFADGGKWRGSIPKALAGEGLIVQAGIVRSDRLARHRGYLARWRAVDLAGIDRKREELRTWLERNPLPAPVSSEPAIPASLFGEDRP